MYRFLFALTFILAGIPFFAIAADESCGEDTSSCSCTATDGVETSLEDDSITDGDSCNASCLSQGAASWEFYCGKSITPMDSGDVDPALGAATTEELVDPAVPVLNVPLPTLSQDKFDNSISMDANGNIETNMIGIYVNAVFTYAITLAALFGVLMLTIAGFQYMTAAGDKSAVSKAKDRMQNTIFGLILLMATYCIAYLIDPRTTYFNPLTLQQIRAVEYFPPEGEDIEVTPNLSLTGEAKDIDGDYLIPGDSDLTIDAEVLTALQEAAEDFYTTYGKQIVIASAKRDLKKQAKLFYDNCLRRGGFCSPITCNPASSSVISKNSKTGQYSLAGSLVGQTNPDVIIASIVSSASYGNCPHTSAVALDLWCNDGGGNYQHDVACQTALITTMIEHGFCRLTAEAWHFELNSKKVSSKCLTTNNTASYTTRKGTFTPSASCKRWDFKNNKCVAAK
jgi:hypothetical protein